MGLKSFKSFLHPADQNSPKTKQASRLFRSYEKHSWSLRRAKQNCRCFLRDVAYQVPKKNASWVCFQHVTTISTMSSTDDKLKAEFEILFRRVGKQSLTPKMTSVLNNMLFDLLSEMTHISAKLFSRHLHYGGGRSISSPDETSGRRVKNRIYS